MRAITLATLLAFALVIGGCKSGDNTASTAPDQTATATSTTGSSTTGTDSTAGTTGAAAETTGSTADNSGNSIVGKWDMTNNPKAPTTYEFKDDGTCEVVVGPTADPSGKMKGKMTITSEQTYKVDGNKITMTLTSLESSSDNDADKDGIDAANKMYADAAKQAKPEEGTVTFKDKDNAVLNINENGKQMEVDLKRQTAS